MDSTGLKTAFLQRGEAALELALRIGYAPDPLVLAIPRSSIVTAAVLARQLRAPLELYQGLPLGISVAGRTVIACDDGVRTGARLIAALQAIRSARPREIVVALVSAQEAAARSLRAHCDRLECVLEIPSAMAPGRRMEPAPQ